MQNLNYYHQELLEEDEEYREMSILKDLLEARMTKMLSDKVNENLFERMRQAKELKERL